MSNLFEGLEKKGWFLAKGIIDEIDSAREELIGGNQKYQDKFQAELNKCECCARWVSRINKVLGARNTDENPISAQKAQPSCDGK